MKPSRPTGLSLLAAATTLSLSLFAPAAFGAGEAQPAPAQPTVAPAAKSDKVPGKKKAEVPDKPKEEAKAAPKAEPKEEPKPDSKPASEALHTIKRGDFELKITLDGVFESAEQTPVSLRPREWSDLTVVSVVDHGTVVKQGDVLVRLETKDLEEQIADLEKAQPLSELALKLARQELETLEKTTPLSLESSRRAKMEGEQDLAYFEDTSRAMQERDARETLKRAENNLAYAREELNQLEKMYQADELTEETEEIILQRSRNDVAYYEWVTEQSKARAERTVNTAIPREHRSLQESVKNLDITWRQTEQSLPETLRKKRLETEAQELALKKSVAKLADLKADLAALTVKAPHDGVAYYGASSRGKWITAATVDRKLVPGGKLTPAEVILTIVKPAPLKIRAAAPENRLRHLTPGVAGLAAPGVDAEAEFKTALESVSLVPYADNTYDALFSVPKAGPDSPVYYPGMTAKVRLDLYEAKDALTAPRKAVHRDAEGHYVHLKDGTKRRIKVGKANDDAYEILSGLKEGDEIKVP